MKISENGFVEAKNDWKPNVYGQVKSWIDGGLEPAQ
jgi:hypothetical protein